MRREVRKKGLGLLWLNQGAGDVNSTAWANTNTLFAFKQISRLDINRVGRIEGAEETMHAAARCAQPMKNGHLQQFNCICSSVKE
jgi:hypothetical protein